MPERIVSLLSAATEMLFALGLGERVVAVSHECDWPTEVARLPRATFSHVSSAAGSSEIDQQVRELTATGSPLYGLDVDLLGRLSPDLIVTQQQCDVCAVRYADVMAAVAGDPRLSGARIVALSPHGLADVLADIRRVGEAAGADEAADRCLTGLQDRINRVASGTAAMPAAERPRTACIEWIEPLMLAANWVPELIELAGGRNGLSVGGQHSTYHAWSDVIEFDPQVIVVSPCGFDLERTLMESQSVSAWPNWSQLSAVKSGRVFAVDGNAYLNRSGPRLVDSLEILAHLLHPELFQPPTCGGWTRVASPSASPATGRSLRRE